MKTLSLNITVVEDSACVHVCVCAHVYVLVLR